MTTYKEPEIKPEELRIGNYYNHVEAGVIKLEPDWISYFAKYPELINGIPLTEDWLIKAGFEPCEDDPDVLYYKKGYFAVNSFMDHSKVWLRYSGRHNGDIQTEVKYVHQLQNLYWCLCGEELTFK